MSEYNYYTGRGTLFGLGYPGADGELGSPHDEGVKVEGIERLFGSMLGALGVGIYEGLLGSLVGGDVHLTAGTAMVEDELGALPIAETAQVIAAAQFSEGVNYVHLQADETARTDGACGYYMSGSATPPAGGVLVCKVTVAGGVITAVDNGVRVPLAINSRLAWAQMTENGVAGAPNLRDVVMSILGAAYFGATPPADVDTRLTDVELAGGGGGGTGREYLGYPTPMEVSPTDGTTYEQVAEAEAQALLDPQIARIDALEAAAGAVAVKPVEQWDNEAWNMGLLTLRLGAVTPTLLYGMRNAATVIGGVYGTAAAHPDGKIFEVLPV